MTRSRRPARKEIGAPAKAPEQGSLGPVLEFMRLLWAVDHGLTSISKKMDRTLGVTGPQRLVVRLVGRRPGISAGLLAETLHVHPSTLTGVLKRLTEREILERRPDPADSRRALFRLTRKGAQLDRLRAGTVEERVRAALARLPDEDLAATGRVLEHLARSLGQR